MTIYLDCRSADTFSQGHRTGATSLPASELFQRMHELAMRDVAIHLYTDDQCHDEALQFLTQRGFTLASQQTWTAEHEQTLKQQGLWEQGHHSVNLWQPSPLVQAFLSDYDGTTGKGLDIACGAGRDLVYLARQGWQMTGVDHHSDALQRCHNLASHNGVEVDTHQLNIETADNALAQTFAPQSFDLICVARYLHRPLFPTIKALLKPNGIVLYQTFMQGCELLGGPRNPNFLLKPHELRECFVEFAILRDEVMTLKDGREVSAFIAQR